MTTTLYRALLTVVAASLVLAAVPGLVRAATPDEAAERAAIERARRDIDARTMEREKACYQLFAVADCLTDVRAKARVELEGLRKREISLNDAERRRNAQLQWQRAQEKAGEQAARDARVQAQPPRQPKEAAPPRAPPTSATLRRAPASAPRPAPPAAENLRRFDQKQTEAQKHKADVLKRLSEQPASGRAKPLPDAP